MAVQMHVAYSSSVEGAGIFAAGPYYYSEGSQRFAEASCSSSQSNLKNYEQYAINQSIIETIDPVSNLKNTTAWVYSGLLDIVVYQDVVKNLVEFYEYFGVKTTAKFDIASQHAWVTDDYGIPCNAIESPYISNCDYDAAGTLLKAIYGESLTRKEQIHSNLKKFDQTFYSDSGSEMADAGFVYYPDVCKTQACKVHIAYHGCKMGIDFIGDVFARHSGLNGWAEGSGIIVVYPQIKKNTSKNPNGCWDWWGYTNKKYPLKSGLQMEATYKMAQGSIYRDAIKRIKDLF